MRSSASLPSAQINSYFCRQLYRGGFVGAFGPVFISLEAQRTIGKTINAWMRKLTISVTNCSQPSTGAPAFLSVAECVIEPVYFAGTGPSRMKWLENSRPPKILPH